MIRRPPRSTLFPTRRSSDLRRVRYAPYAHDVLLSEPLRRRICHRQYRSEEHTSELQSQSNIVCRLLLEKKKDRTTTHPTPSSRSTYTRLLSRDGLCATRDDG